MSCGSTCDASADCVGPAEAAQVGRAGVFQRVQIPLDEGHSSRKAIQGWSEVRSSSSSFLYRHPPRGTFLPMPTTMDMLETSYPVADSPPQTTTTMTARADYDGCWAVSTCGCEWHWGASAAPHNVVVEDRLAANPINHIDPRGTDEASMIPQVHDIERAAKLKFFTKSFIADRGQFRIDMYDDPRNAFQTTTNIYFVPNGNVTAGCNCSRIGLVQLTSVTARYLGPFNFWSLFNKDTDYEIDADYPELFNSIIDWTPGQRQAELDDNPGLKKPQHEVLLSQSFKTYAICMEGKEAGHSYGYIAWGHSMEIDTSGYAPAIINKTLWVEHYMLSHTGKLSTFPTAKRKGFPSIPPRKEFLPPEVGDLSGITWSWAPSDK
jgi:hypothetical protein